ncbi:MAG: hypothetical protein CME61_06720 [Halobacteriovoraceae bacterium]|nr:hypothetical protein [Halobacteriovoraceae bacterium]
MLPFFIKNISSTLSNPGELESDKVCKKEKELIPEKELIKQCIIDLCGPASENLEGILTTENLEDGVDKKYLKELDKRKKYIFKKLEEKNKSYIKEIDNYISDLEKIDESKYHQMDVGEFVQNFIKFKPFGDKYELVTPLFFDQNILSKKEYDSLIGEIQNNTMIKKHHYMMYNSPIQKTDKSEGSQEKKYSLRARCDVLKEIGYDCGLEKNSKKYFKNAVEFNMDKRDSFKRGAFIFSDDDEIKRRVEFLQKNIDYILDPKVKEEINKFDNNKDNKGKRLIDLEKKFIDSILPLPGDNVNYQLSSNKEIVELSQKIKDVLDPKRLIKQLEQAKKKLQHVDLNEQFENLKIDMILLQQNIRINNDAKKFNRRKKQYLKKFLTHIDSIFSEDSAKKIRKAYKKLTFKEPKRTFDWFGLNFRDWKRSLDSSIKSHTNHLPKRKENTLDQSSKDLGSGLMNLHKALFFSDVFELKNINTRGLVDKYDPVKKTIHSSFYTCSDHRGSEGVFYHELAHALSDFFNDLDDDLSTKSKLQFKTTRDCVTSQYRHNRSTISISKGIDLDHVGDNLYTEEDFADFISNSVTYNKDNNFTCSLLTVTRGASGKFEYPSESLTIWNADRNARHSVAFKRILYSAIQKGRPLSPSCWGVYNKNKDYFKFSPCGL